MTGLIGSIIIGILAGFLAGKIMRGGGYGCLVNLILGILGGAFGGCELTASVSRGNCLKNSEGIGDAFF